MKEQQRVFQRERKREISKKRRERYPPQTATEK
jgi:hypothetical protein